jgi:hypothetical protein
MGMPPDQVAAMLRDMGCTDSFDAFPETIEALEVFNVVATQWRMRTVPIGMGASQSVPFGLDYTACESILRARQITVSPDTWADLQVIEKEIIENGPSRR